MDVEIDPEVDFDSRRAVYFRQMRYGLFVSVLSLVFCFIQTSFSKDSHGSPRQHYGIKFFGYEFMTEHIFKLFMS